MSRIRIFPAAAAAVLIPALLAQTIPDAQRREAAGDWAGAAQIWQSLADTMPQDYRLWTSLGVALVHQDRFAEAITAYRKALAIAPRDPQTNFNLGLAYFKSNRLADAIEPLRTAAAVMPTNAQIDLLLGMSLYGTAHFHDSAAALERAKREGQPQTAQLQQVLAQCYIRAKEYEKAKAELTEMLRSNPDSASTHMLLGEAEDASGHSGRAVEEFRAAIAADNRLPNLHFGLGYLLWKDRAYEQAEAEFRKEIALDPKHAQALSYLGDVLLKSGAQSEAESVLRRAVATGSKLWLTQLDLGIIASNKKAWASAATHLQQAAKLAPDRTEPHYRLAQVYKATGDSAKSAAELQKVSTMHRQQEEDLVQKISGPSAQ